jgi:hypothetical protein
MVHLRDGVWCSSHKVGGRWRGIQVLAGLQPVASKSGEKSFTDPRRKKVYWLSFWDEWPLRAPSMQIRRLKTQALKAEGYIHRKILTASLETHPTSFPRFGRERNSHTFAGKKQWLRKKPELLARADLRKNLYSFATFYKSALKNIFFMYNSNLKSTFWGYRILR